MGQGRGCMVSILRVEVWEVQGYLAHKKQRPPSTLQQDYA
jgi:hypothetical protein